MMKVDRIFKRFVELKFEDFFNNHFLLNNRYLPLDENTSIFLSHFKSFGKYLKDELDKSKNEIEKRKNIEYIKKLIKTGHTLIDEIKGRGVYLYILYFFSFQFHFLIYLIHLLNIFQNS